MKFETIARLIIIVNTKGYGTHSRCNSYIRSFSWSLPSSIFFGHTVWCDPLHS